MPLRWVGTQEPFALTTASPRIHTGLGWWSKYRNLWQCLVCHTQKYEAVSPAGLLQLLSISTWVWEDIFLNFIIGLPRSQGNDAILVVVDRFTKYAHFLGLWHPYTAKMVAKLFAKEIIRLHGMPKSIASDWDPIFLGFFLSELFRLQGTQLRMSMAYHLRWSNGGAEWKSWNLSPLFNLRTIKILKQMVGLGRILV